MNRLQKKCLLVTAGFHLLLLLILVVGPGFFTPKNPVNDLPVLTAIPSQAVDALLSSGVKAAPPPPPTPKPVVVTPPTPVQAPLPTPTPTPPAPKPAPSMMEELKTFFRPTPVKPEPSLRPDELKLSEKPVKPKEHKVDISLKEVHTTIKAHTPDDSKAQAREEKRLRDERLRVIREAQKDIAKNASSSTEIAMPGDSSADYANYGQIVKSVYDQAWHAPDHAANEDANTKVKVVIGSDGHVISAEIIEPSGDDAVDRSVQRTLDNVQFIHEFPEGSKEKSRTYIINFNLKDKQLNG
jgi:TonB family protein